MAKRVIRPYVADFLVKHVGQVVTLQQITKGMPAGTSPEAVQTCVRNLIIAGDLEITVIARGKSWRLESLERPDMVEAAAPVQEQDGALCSISLVGTMSDGTLVVKDEDGRLYRLIAL